MQQETKHEFDFQKDVIDRSMNGPVLVDFYLPKCGPCQQIAPMLNKAVEEGAYDLLKLDLQQPQVRPITIQYKVDRVPRLLLFSRGKLVWDSNEIKPFNVIRIASMAKVRAQEAQVKRHDPVLVRAVKWIASLFTK